MLRRLSMSLAILATAAGSAAAQIDTSPAPPLKATERRPRPDRVLAEALWRTICFGPDHPVVKASEPAAMLATILKGGAMDGADGWFHPGTSRFGWPWLAARHSVGTAEAIPRMAWRGSPELFDRLDRNHDGELTAADFDWSAGAAATREERMYRQWLSKIDTDANGKITRKEWESYFDKLASGKEHFNAEDLRRAFPLSPPTGSGKPPGQKMPAGFQQTLLKGFFHSELGSPFEGPRVDQPAPDFTLPTHDGKQRITLSDCRGKPVVLIFGSLT